MEDRIYSKKNNSFKRSRSSKKKTNLNIDDNPIGFTPLSLNSIRTMSKSLAGYTIKLIYFKKMVGFLFIFSWKRNSFDIHKEEGKSAFLLHSYTTQEENLIHCTYKVSGGLHGFELVSN